MRSPSAPLLPGLLAATFEGAALALACGERLTAALGLHAIAVLACTVAVGRRPGAGRVDRDLVILLAAFAPPFGAVLGWLLPPGPGGRGHDAHEEFESGGTAALAGVDWASRAASAEIAESPLPLSFDEILRFGSIVHRRNALRRLAELGGPHHLRLVRRALQHDDPELRLAAFAELDRVGRRHEDRIEAQRQVVASSIARLGEQALASQLEIARLTELHTGFAHSGVLDEAMADYHLRCATRHGALLIDRGDAPLAIRNARYTAAIANGRAAEVLEQLRFRPMEGTLFEIRARALWQLRRFGELHQLVERGLRGADLADLPGWLQAFADLRREGPTTVAPHVTESAP